MCLAASKRKPSTSSIDMIQSPQANSSFRTSSTLMSRSQNKR